MNESNDAATLLMLHQVKADSKNRYESWTRKLRREAQRFHGRLDIKLIHPHDAATLYTLVLQFESHQDLTAWMASKPGQRLISKAQPLLCAQEYFELQTGLEYTFPHPRDLPGRSKPLRQLLRDSLSRWTAMLIGRPGD